MSCSRKALACKLKNRVWRMMHGNENISSSNLLSRIGTTRKNLASRTVPLDCRQAQDARRHGWYGPEGQLTSASVVKKPAESTTLQGFVRQCRVVRWRDHSKGLVSAFFCTFHWSQVLSGPPALRPE